ncbi:MAG TPA: ATP-binding cassette domain-containing protein [Vicinamibacterales bacterium]|nr:ATP-binding cassette domain-containing protein [Vicinamibacterales bacterium]
MDPDLASILEVRDLRRRYGRLAPVEAVRGVSFTARRGEIFGLIGPDGAGKTSIIQMLAGVLRPHGGAASVEGLDVVRAGEAVKRRIGYMPQGLGSNLYDSLTVHENIEFFRDLRKLPDDVYRRNRAELLAATRLAPFLDRRAANLSGGMRQKLALICTLIHLPDILLLDEPTTGVDPISRQEFWQIIGRLVEIRRATVLVSTSYMDEAERCHRIALLYAGAIVAEGTPEDVRRRARGHFVRLAAVPQATALRLLRERRDVQSTEVFGDELHVNFHGELRDIERALLGGGVTLGEVALQEPGLEDVFLQLLSVQPTEPSPAGISMRRDAERERPLVDPGMPPTDRGGVPVQCRAVTRRFGAFTAVEAVNLAVRRGEIFGLLGPNGAGKTTLIKMMCGLLEPGAGSIEIGGIDVRSERERVWTAIGYMSQRFSLYQDLTVNQNLQLYADLYGLQRSAYADLVARLGLDPFASRLTGDLPIGVRQRVSLLCAVLHHPSTVFLDEPTSGVDPHARRLFWDLIYALSRDAGITVLVSTHYMDEAAHCDRLGLMHQGRLIAEGSPAELRQQSEERSGGLLAIRTADPRRAWQLLSRVRPQAVVYGDHIRVRTFQPDSDRAALAGALADEGIDRVRIETVPISMDEAFIDFVRRAEALRA